MNRRRFLALLAALPFVEKRLLASNSGVWTKHIGCAQEMPYMPPTVVYWKDIGPKYEWICGPFSTQPTPSVSFVGREDVIIYGQVRNRRNGRTANWCKQYEKMETPSEMAALIRKYPKALDWEENFRNVNADADTINDPLSEFDRALIKSSTISRALQPLGQGSSLA